MTNVTDLAAFASLVPLDHGLCVVSTVRADGGVQASVVNAGVLAHTLTGDDVVGLVAAGGSQKLRTADVIGPDDPNPGVDSEAQRLLLRAIFQAAGGVHDDWATYDRVMAEERRAAVLVTPGRTYSALQTG